MLLKDKGRKGGVGGEASGKRQGYKAFLLDGGTELFLEEEERFNFQNEKERRLSNNES